ncbi:MAG: nucleoside deaminase [Lachnospiraceae bacterium]|jgi:tRNA(adenine34) deaminase|nr:nucleoside deaminase [Lachnospiraceae bacterium]
MQTYSDFNTDEKHEMYMRLALKEAKEGINLGETPIGCVIVYGGSQHEKAENRRESEALALTRHKTMLIPGQVIGSGYNRRNTDRSPLAHAEITAIAEAVKLVGDWRLDNCIMYVTLEPCQMCAGAIIQARIPMVVIGAMNPKAGCAGSLLNILEMPKFNHQAKVVRGVLADECSSLLTGFFRELREGRG